jgi:hypothetical protein
LSGVWNILGTKPSLVAAIFSNFQAEGQSNHQDFWSGRWESNPRSKLGNKNPKARLGGVNVSRVHGSSVQFRIGPHAIRDGVNALRTQIGRDIGRSISRQKVEARMSPKCGPNLAFSSLLALQRQLNQRDFW